MEYVYFCIFCECFPLKVVRTKANKVPADPVIVECKSRLDVLLVLSRHHAEYCELYKQTKKEYDRYLIASKVGKYEKRINDSDNKNKTMWAICNEIRGKTPTKNECLVKGNMKNVVNNLNNFFL